MGSDRRGAVVLFLHPAQGPAGTRPVLIFHCRGNSVFSPTRWEAELRATGRTSERVQRECCFQLCSPSTCLFVSAHFLQPFPLGKAPEEGTQSHCFLLLGFQCLQGNPGSTQGETEMTEGIFLWVPEDTEPC